MSTERERKIEMSTERRKDTQKARERKKDGKKKKVEWARTTPSCSYACIGNASCTTKANKRKRERERERERESKKETDTRDALRERVHMCVCALLTDLYTVCAQR